MFDFNLNIQEETQLLHFVFFLVVYFLAFLFNRRMVNLPFKKSNSRNEFGTVFLYLSLVTLTIVAVTRGDFYHYAEMVQYGVKETHLEEIYQWLIVVVNRNYFLWRVVVWGMALTLFFITAKRLEVDVKYSALVLFLCYIHIFNYARVSLACAVYFFGLSYLIKPNKHKLFSYIIGAVIIWCSHFFHNTVYVLVVITLIVLIPINKYTIIIVVLAIITSARIGYSYLFDRMSIMEGDEGMADLFLLYSGSRKRIISGGLSGLLTSIMEYGAFFIPLIIFTRRVIFSSKEHDKIAVYLYKIIFFITIFAIVMWSQTQTAYFFYRFLYMSIIPISFLLVYSREKGIITDKEYKMCIYWGMANIFYINVYGIYSKIIA